MSLCEKHDIVQAVGWLQRRILRLIFATGRCNDAAVIMQDVDFDKKG